MAGKAILDLDKLAAEIAPFRLVLALSAAVGVLLGLTVIGAMAFAALMATPIAFGAFLLAIAALSATMTHWLLIGCVVILAIPLGAMLATHWRLKNMERFILEDCGSRPPANSKMGEVMQTLSHFGGLSRVPNYGVLQDVDNAFAYSAGPSAGMVLMGTTLLGRLESAEILAIMGHEIGHIAMRDSERKMLMIGHQEFLTRFLIFAGLKRTARAIFGFIGELALAAHSRHREYWADAVGAHITSPETMISALSALDGHHKPKPFERQYAALMFRPVNQLFSTHPTNRQRIVALQNRTYLDRLPIRQPAQEPLSEESEAEASYGGI